MTSPASAGQRKSSFLAPGFQRQSGGFIGLNDSARAKAYLGELYALDSDRHIDPQMFSPKVIRLAEEAKAEQEQLRCRSVSDEAQKELEIGNGDALVQLIGSSQTKCAGLAAFYPKAADLVFKEGVEAYKKAQMAEALQKFRAALVLQPQLELAAQYVDLTESKLEVTAERALLAWRKDFNAGEFALAARDYRELKSLSSSQTIDDVHMEYRRVLSSLVDSWNRACVKDDMASMENIQGGSAGNISINLPITALLSVLGLGGVGAGVSPGDQGIVLGICLARSSTSNQPGQEPAEDLNRREQRGAWQQSRSGDLLSPTKPKRFPKPLQMQSDRTGTKLRTFVTVSAGTKQSASSSTGNGQRLSTGSV